ncbi:hypothetical protein BDV12DRAFT_178570 [Aspergillus spectabilis]
MDRASTRFALLLHATFPGLSVTTHCPLWLCISIARKRWENEDSATGGGAQGREEGTMHQHKLHFRQEPKPYRRSSGRFLLHLKASPTNRRETLR